MRKAKVAIISGLTALVILLLDGCVAGHSQQENQSLGPNEHPLSNWDLSPRQSDAAGVSLEVQPLTPRYDEDVWEFGMALDTHSGNLNYDLTEVTVLRCDQGEEYRPLSWEGSPPGGHHRQGVLRFAALDHSTSLIEIVINNVADVPERVFRWELGPQIGG